jgi:hypothetical protein
LRSFLGNSIKPSPQENSAKTNYKFTDEYLKRFEQLGLDIQDALDAGHSPEDISIAAKPIEQDDIAAQNPQPNQSCSTTPVPLKPLS